MIEAIWFTMGIYALCWSVGYLIKPEPDRKNWLKHWCDRGGRP